MGCFHPKECLCGVHVNTATKIVAIGQILLVIFYGSSKHFADTTLKNRIILSVILIDLVLTGLLLYGNINRRPILYIPYIMFNVSWFVVNFLAYAFIVFFLGFNMLFNEHMNTKESSFLIKVPIPLLIYVIIPGYFLSIIIRSYRILDEETIQSSSRAQFATNDKQVENPV